MFKVKATLLLGLMLFVLSTATTMALDKAAQEQFDQYMDMNLRGLADVSAQKLTEKYPDEDWAKWHFPDYVYTDAVVETSYKVAVKAPEILGMANISDEGQVVPCYCTCQEFGHDNLLYCFWKNGQVNGEFDEHGSQCAVCMRQALLAFLWAGLGATHAEIMEGMQMKFAPLIKMKQEGKF